MEFRKNDLVTLEIEDCGIDGEGIGKADGFTVFVKDAVIGDTVTAKIIKAKKNYGYGRLMEVLKPSPYRVEPKCEFARQCGGCQLQALSYDQQLVFKTNKVKGIWNVSVALQISPWSRSLAWMNFFITEIRHSFL